MSNNIPAELKYVSSHEWLRAEADGHPGSVDDRLGDLALLDIIDACDLDGVEEVVDRDFLNRSGNITVAAGSEGVGHKVDESDLHVVV